MIAPAKLNLCLYVGPRREDGLHELCSLFAPISLADELKISEADGERDEVICPAVEGPDLTARALAALRENGWKRAPLRIEVGKRIPVAAGLGGGSADAAAVLRLAADDFEPERLAAIAAGLGADVPSQIRPAFALVSGAGERVTPLPEPDGFGVLLLPDPAGLSTAAVYAEADRLGSIRAEAELERLRGDLLAATVAGESPLAYVGLLHNDLASAALSLQPAIEDTLAELRDAGAAHAFVTGSGPTAVGLFGSEARAETARERLGKGIVAASGKMG